ncbi:MAG: hypothetical protein ABIH38_04890 [Patescibacteria group bacterium]
MSSKTNKILFMAGIFFLVALLPLEIFLSYDTTTRQLALALTDVESLLIILIIYWFFKTRHQIIMPFYVVWSVSLGVWFDAAGNFANLYHSIVWWDNLAHMVGSAAVALAFFVILYELNKQKKIKLGLFSLSLFSLSVTIFASAMYEVSEYLGDVISLSNRIVDKFDTPSDLMWNTIAALGVVLVASLTLYFKTRTANPKS